MFEGWDVSSFRVFWTGSFALEGGGPRECHCGWCWRDSVDPDSPDPISLSWGHDSGKAYQSAGAVDACVAGVDAVEPLGLAELPKALLRHGGGRDKEAR